MITYPDINPIAFSLGPLDFRWYGIAYVSGFLALMFMAKRLARQWRYPLSVLEIDDVLVGFILGVVVGGRLGEVLFYHPDFYFTHPLEILKVWKGGMSFHGGLLGSILAFYLAARRMKIPPLLILDAIAPLVPPGLFFGRIANFINAELIGRPTDVPWAMIFPYSDGLPRHPSQLYEALGEGLILFIVLYVFAFWRTQPSPLPTTTARPANPNALRAQKSAGKSKQKAPTVNDAKANDAPLPHPRRILGARPLGQVSGVFLIGYGFIRFLIEYTRTPDTFMGIYPLGFSMGQFLCLPMVALGLYLAITAQNRQAAWDKPS